MFLSAAKPIQPAIFLPSVGSISWWMPDARLGEKIERRLEHPLLDFQRA